MKMFDLRGVSLSLCTPEINSLLNSIELYKGKTLYVEKLKKIDALKRIARKKSVLSSNAIGSIFIEEKRENPILDKKSSPATLQEHLVLGYNNALDLIDEVHKYQPVDLSFISTLHYYLYKDYNPEFGGRYKDSINFVQESMPDGSFRTIFVGAAPEDVVPLLDNLIYQFNMCAADETINKLVLISTFMFDFMCIHPYNHGNGRVSRLLLNFLLKKFGYNIEDYFAIPYLMKQHISDYIDSFEESSKKWHEDENDYSQFVTFILKRILEAYRKLDYIIEVNNLDGTSEEKTLKVVCDSSTPISKTMINNVLYATSATTIEKALADLLKAGRIQLITKGRYSKYFRT